jgi:hypothetical protein
MPSPCSLLILDEANKKKTTTNKQKRKKSKNKKKIERVGRNKSADLRTNKAAAVKGSRDSPGKAPVARRS